MQWLKGESFSATHKKIEIKIFWFWIDILRPSPWIPAKRKFDRRHHYEHCTHQNWRRKKEFHSFHTRPNRKVEKISKLWEFRAKILDKLEKSTNLIWMNEGKSNAKKWKSYLSNVIFNLLGVQLCMIKISGSFFLFRHQCRCIIELWQHLTSYLNIEGCLSRSAIFICTIVDIVIAQWLNEYKIYLRENKGSSTIFEIEHFTILQNRLRYKKNFSYFELSFANSVSLACNKFFSCLCDVTCDRMIKTFSHIKLRLIPDQISNSANVLTRSFT